MNNTSTSSVRATNKLIPDLRFPEFVFDGEWNIKRLADIGNIQQGFGFPETYQGKKSGEYPFIKVSDISNTIQKGNHIIKEAVNYIDSKDVKDLRAKTIPIGTTIFAKIGEAIRLNRRAITSCESLIDNNVAGLKAIEGKAIDSFIFYILSKIDLIEYSGGAVPSVNKTTLENIPVFTPKSEIEQLKIANCLSSLDEVIAAHSQKLDALKTHKKGLMQNLFPQEGETLPKWRFAEFVKDGEWVENPLDKVCEINPKVPQLPEQFVYIDLESVENGTLLQKKIIKSNGAPSRAQRLLKENDVIFQMVRPYQKNNYFFKKDEDYDYVASTGYAQLRSFESSMYLYQFIHTDRFVSNLIEKCTGSNYPAINSSDLSQISIQIPKPQEQQKIAECLSSLDELITAQTKKIELLKLHKKGLMQCLFPKNND